MKALRLAVCAVLLAGCATPKQTVAPARPSILARHHHPSPTPTPTPAPSPSPTATPSPSPVPSPAHVNLAWNAVTGARGYMVFQGSTPGSYNRTLDVGNVLANTVGNLTAAQRYYFVVRCYDGNGNQSPPSNEVSGVAQ